MVGLHEMYAAAEYFGGRGGGGMSTLPFGPPDPLLCAQRRNIEPELMLIFSVELGSRGGGH